MLLCPPSKKWGYVALHMSVGPSVLVRSITKEPMVKVPSNLVWWLVMTPIEFGISLSNVKITVIMKLKNLSDQ